MIRVCFLMCALMALGCGGKFNRKDIQGDVAEKPDPVTENRLKSLPDSEIRDLSDNEKSEVANMVYDFLLNKRDHLRFTKAFCHIGAVYRNPGEKATCEETRDKCLEEAGKYEAQQIKDHVQKQEKTIKDFVKNSQYSPKAYLAAFAIFRSDNMAKLTKPDCGASSEQLYEAVKELKSSLASEFGQQVVDEAEKLMKRMVGLV